MAYEPNFGKLPDECVATDDDGAVSYRLVHVRLFGGSCTKKAGAAPWPDAGRQPATRWAISRPPHPYEIEEWELA